ncbi:hypothetical protein [Fibrella aquatica]|jgi:hypothetical protein|uniref:hypothetical protein n=1 Tax=Fibrella aquatica TaxID=3242487 RepID=UPI003522A06B
MPDQDPVTSRRISSQLISYLVGGLTLDDFAQWVKATPELRSILSPTDYAALMSIDFQHTESPSLLDKLLRGYIDWAQHEKEQLAELLMAIIWKDRPLTALVSMYEKFTHGLTFLNTLGNEYGKSILSTYGANPESVEGHESTLMAVYPKARDEAKRILHSLVSGKITFTGTYTQEGHPEYIER